jgi:cyclase
MLRKRIIFSLIYDSEKFTQSRNFRLQRVGGIRWLEKNYKFQQIAWSLDELIVMDATRGGKDKVKFSKTLSKLVDDVFIPITAGGGITCQDDAKLLFDSGADKIVVNSLAYNDPAVLVSLASKYGSQSVVVSVDFKKEDGKAVVYIENGTKRLGCSIEEHLLNAQERGAGEIYLNSIDQDGTGFGYDIESINCLNSVINVPLIIAGGAGNQKHLIEGLALDNVDGVATANLFNFVGNGLPKARTGILAQNGNLANWGEL